MRHRIRDALARPVVEEGTDDVRTLVGMHTVGGLAAVTVYAALMVVVAVDAGVGASPWTVLAAAVFGSVLLVLVGVPGDPLPILATVWVVVGADAVTLVSIIPARLPNPGLQNWGHGACILALGFLCVRGRTVAAWLGLAGGIVALSAWFAANGSTAADGFVSMFSDIGVLTLSSVFAVTLRPAARTVYALRDARVAQNAELAASVAANREREAQLHALDRSVRPLLARIAAGTALSADERRECAVARPDCGTPCVRHDSPTRPLSAPPSMLAAGVSRSCSSTTPRTADSTPTRENASRAPSWRCWT
ncbi:MAG: hypothetical protein PGN29_10410 [Gordonia paraffinivorans]